MEFKDLLELYKNGRYEEVVLNAQNINDYNALFLLLRSFIALSEYENALDIYLSNRDTLESHNLIESIKVYLFLLIETNAPSSKLNREIEYFKDKNYVNQETEEFICELDKYVDSLKSKSEPFEKYSIEEVIEMLKSNDEVAVFTALRELTTDEKYKTIPLFPTIETILKERGEMSLTYGMLLDFLVGANYKCELFFRNGSKYYTVDPSQNFKESVQQIKLMRQALAHIQSNEKNISIGDYVIKIMVKASYQLAPLYIKNLHEMSSYVCAAYILASDVFKVSLDGDSVFEFYMNLSDSNLIDGYRDFLRRAL